jgi:hypothetical protein
MKDLKVEVIGVKKRCGAKHKPGDYFYVRGGGMVEVPKGKKVCLYALNSLFPFLTWSAPIPTASGSRSRSFRAGAVSRDPLPTRVRRGGPARPGPACPGPPIPL